MRPDIQAFWQAFRQHHPHAPEIPPAIFHFCDNREDADLCAKLVREGKKRATACSLAELEAAGEPVPKPGDLALVTDWSGAPVAVIRTRSVEIRAFRDVDEAFAREEGEGDLTLQWWREAHRAYYTRVLSGTDHSFTEDMKIACERFEVIYSG